jgi:hypothetical protein
MYRVNIPHGKEIFGAIAWDAIIRKSQGNWKSLTARPAIFKPIVDIVMLSLVLLMVGHIW